MYSGLRKDTLSLCSKNARMPEISEFNRVNILLITKFNAILCKRPKYKFNRSIFQ